MKKSKINILLVEDDSGHAILVSKAFGHYRERFRLDIVGSIKEANDYLEEKLPHLILTDLVLPDGRGTELIITGEEVGVPIIVMTGYGDEEVAVDILKAGALDYVVKRDSSLRDMPRIADRVLRQWENIVERKRAEKALTESEGKFRALIENAGNLIIILDNKSVFRYLSPAVVDITGFSADAMLARPAVEFIHPDDNEFFQKILSQTQRVSESVPIPRFRVRHKEEYWINMEGMVTDMGNIPGVEGVVINCNDVTELRRMEERLNRMHKLESIGMLAGGIAHDYNNILTIILGHLSVAKITDDRVKQKNSLLESEKALFKARDLTQQLLTFAEGGAPVKETACLKDVIKDAAEFSLRGSNVSLHLDIQEDLYAVSMDRGQISQAINNLVINADQSMPDGGALYICAQNTPVGEGNNFGLVPGKYIKVDITDQGIGILNKYREKVFDPYFTTKGKGSGLGLSIVHSIILKHNGFVDLVSQPGKGTTFFVYLPASETGEDPRKEQPMNTKGEGNILIMDDEEGIREVTSLLLQSLGFTVVGAADGREAVEACKREHFDAAILDLVIPGGMGGKETVKAIKEIDKDIKVIVSSGYSNDPIMARYGEYGFDGVLMKPYRLEEVARTIHKILTSE
ncbi:MAG: response regulator [bacterium]|nr:response regulator [bacterium]